MPPSWAGDVRTGLHGETRVHLAARVALDKRRDMLDVIAVREPCFFDGKASIRAWIESSDFDPLTFQTASPTGSLTEVGLSADTAYAYPDKLRALRRVTSRNLQLLHGKSLIQWQ